MPLSTTGSSIQGSPFCRSRSPWRRWGARCARCSMVGRWCAVLLVLATPLAAQQQAPAPKPWFVYLRDGGQSPLYLFASYSFGVPIVTTATPVYTPPAYHEHLPAPGLHPLASN